VIELFHNDMSVCAQKVRIALVEKALPWTGHHLNLRAGDQFRPEYLKLNPNGIVPTIIDNGRAIIESTIICEYLDEAYPDTPLRPKDAYARARMRLWTKKLDDFAHVDTATLSFCIAFRHQLLQRLITPEALEAHLALIPSKERQERQRTNIAQGFASPLFEEALRRWAKLFKQLNDALSKSRWLAGDEYSLADIGYTPYYLRLEQLGLSDVLVGTRVRAWAERVMKRPSYAVAIEKWLNPNYVALFDVQRAEAICRARSLLACG
jgi:glutathione S-transferase